MRKLLGYILVLVLFQIPAAAQVESFISVESNQYLIGDQIKIDFILKLDESNEVVEIDLNGLGEIYSNEGEADSLGKMIYPLADLNILDYGYWQTNKNERFSVKEVDWQVEKLNKTKIFQNQITLSFWEIGSFEIPDIKYIIKANGELKEYDSRNSAKLIITVPGKLQEMSPDSIEIAPIKDILKEPSLFADYLPYLYTGLSLLLIGMLFYYLRSLKNEKKEEIIPEIILPAHVIAQQQLDELEKKELWQNDQVKAYQSQLTHIIREYLENRYDIHALEMTTDEIVAQLKNSDFEMKWKDGLKKTLTIADLVKFAKAEPPLEINEEFLTEARGFIENTKRIEEETEINQDN